MKLISLEIQGFRPFGENRQVFVFPSEPGLYRGDGINEAEPELGANGSGKSSFWDAVKWVIDGETVRGRSGPEVESWFGGQTDGILKLELEGEPVEIRRTRSPIRLMVNGEQMEQEELDALLGLKGEALLHSCMLGQFNPFFFDLKPAGRLKLFTEVFDLERWVKRSERAKSRLKVLGSDEVRFEHSIEKQSTKWEEQKKRKRDLKDSAKREAESRAKARESLQGRVDELKEVRDETDHKSAVALRKEQAASAALKRVSKKLDVEIDKAKVLEEKEAFLQQKTTGLRRQISGVHKEVERLQALEGDCPTCLSPIDEEHIGNAVTVCDLKLNDHQKEIDGFDESIDRLADKRGKHEELAGELQEEEDAYEEERKEAQQDHRHQSSRRSDTVKELTRLQNELEEAEEEPESAVEDALKDVVEDMKETKVAHKEAKAALKTTRGEIAALDFWPQGFKDIRLWIVEQTLKELDITVNAAAQALGLHGWRIDFDVEKETKSGTIARGFSVSVTSPQSGKSMPWESWSGGETQRLRLAGQLGMANLIRSKMPHPPQFEVWDEPTRHLNKQGVIDLIAFLHSRGRDGMQVWLVDHQALDSGAFAGTMMVTKKTDGAVISYE